MAEQPTQPASLKELIEFLLTQRKTKFYDHPTKPHLMVRKMGHKIEIRPKPAT